MPLRLLLLVAVLARSGDAQVLDTSQRAGAAIVGGVVHDSITHQPLAGATVQLVSDNLTSVVRTVVSDSLGRFSLGDVQAGRYKLGFLHPILDSIGVEPPPREVHVDGRRPVRVDLAIPSPTRIRTAICGRRRARDSSSVLVGVVRDGRLGEPAGGVRVTAEWLEFTFSSNGLARCIARLDATTAENGWFAMCSVPSAGTLELSARRGADTTDFIEVPLSPEGFVRADLYLGPSRTSVAIDSAHRAEGVAAVHRPLPSGDARLSGTVHAVSGGQPLQGALVSITAGPQTRANERGEWLLTDLPVGTRMLEVRAVGYYPERRQVNIVAGAPPVRLALSTLRAVLDTVRIVAARVRGRDLRGFIERSRSGAGRYLDEAEIARRNPLVASDLFRMMPGLRVERTTHGEISLTMRGIFSDSCVPAFYIDGHHFRNLNGDDIDTWVQPKEIAGIEVYTGPGRPPQFHEAMSDCGSIVIWTK